MAKKIERLTTGEFSKLTGVPAATVTKLIRDGKLKAVKEAGKWMIAKSQSKLKILKEHAKPLKPAANKTVKPKKAPAEVKKAKPKPAETPSRSKSAAVKPKPSPALGGGKTYTVPEFSALTYLTDFGVIAWLKQGRLQGSMDDTGQWRVAASSLDLPTVKRLMRQ